MNNQPGFAIQAAYQWLRAPQVGWCDRVPHFSDSARKDSHQAMISIPAQRDAPG